MCDITAPSELFLFLCRHVSLVLGRLHFLLVLVGQYLHFSELFVAVVAVVASPEEETHDDERADDGEGDDGRASQGQVDDGWGGRGEAGTANEEGDGCRGALVGVRGGVGEVGQVVGLLLFDGGCRAGGVGGAAGVGVVVDAAVWEHIGDLAGDKKVNKRGQMR